MTDILVIAVVVFLIAAAVTLCLTAVLAPHHATRQRAKELLLQLVHGRGDRR